MATILFDMFPATGHLNGVFGIAQMLQQQGHRVIFFCSTLTLKLVRSRGMEFYLVEPFIFQLDKFDASRKGLIRYSLEGLLEHFTQQRCRQVDRTFDKYDQLLERINPDLVILDEHFPHKVIYYTQKKVKLLTVQTTVATGQDDFVPPFKYGYLPKRNRTGQWLTQWLWLLYKLKKLKNRMYYQVLSWNNDHFSSQQKVAQALKYPFKERICFSQSYEYRFKDVTCLITPSKSFDFPRSHQSDLHWIHPCPALPLADTFDSRYQRVVETLVTQKAEGSYDKLIYCSLGSLTKLRLRSAHRFFQKFMQVCMAYPRHRFVLCIGEQEDVSSLLPTPANLYIFRQIPQTHFLSHCDLMITHGGVNSVIECINAAVPMLVFPLLKISDQPGNAARVVYHGLGVRGNVKNSAQTISRKLSQLIDHYDWYKTNVSHMKASFEQSDADNALDIIKAMLPNQTGTLITA